MKPNQQLNIFLTIMAVTMGLASLGLAARVTWQSTPGSTNTDSGGTPFDGTVSFEIGTFEVGFTPTAGNVAQWASKWSVIDRTTYNPEHKFFASSAIFQDNEAPYTQGLQAYMWGTTGGSAPEWILATNGEWLWPGADLSFPVKWNIEDASVTVVGTINASGDPFLMKTAAVGGVVGSSLNAAQWLVQHFGADEPVETLHLDSDGDGRDNMMEMALGTDPKVPEAEASVPYKVDWVQISGFYYLRLTVSKQAIQRLNYRVEVSGNLKTWQSGSSHTSVLVNNVRKLSVRDNVAFEVGQTRFIRLTVAQ